MVDVGHKPEQKRAWPSATAGWCALPETITLKTQRCRKETHSTVAASRASGAGHKSTASLIPPCHTLPLTKVAVDFEVGDDSITIHCEAATRAQTGVEWRRLAQA